MMGHEIVTYFSSIVVISDRMLSSFTNCFDELFFAHVSDVVYTSDMIIELSEEHELLRLDIFLHFFNV